MGRTHGLSDLKPAYTDGLGIALKSFDDLLKVFLGYIGIVVDEVDNFCLRVVQPDISLVRKPWEGMKISDLMTLDLGPRRLDHLLGSRVITRINDQNFWYVTGVQDVLEATLEIIGPVSSANDDRVAGDHWRFPGVSRGLGS